LGPTQPEGRVKIVPERKQIWIGIKGCMNINGSLRKNADQASCRPWYLIFSLAPIHDSAVSFYQKSTAPGKIGKITRRVVGYFWAGLCCLSCCVYTTQQRTEINIASVYRCIHHQHIRFPWKIFSPNVSEYLCSCCAAYIAIAFLRSSPSSSTSSSPSSSIFSSPSSSTSSSPFPSISSSPSSLHLLILFPLLLPVLPSL
jgi:hypothetical protein